MRYSADHKDQTRARLLKAAAEQMRLHGPNGISVADLMSRVGLTHGGFYAHFESKDALIAAAVETMFEDSARRREKALDQCLSLELFIDNYLSPAHRDNPARGCPMPALMSEASRWSPAVRKAFDRGVAGLAEHVAELLPANVRNAHGTAMALLASMAGMLSLARAIYDRTLSDELLSSGRHATKRRFLVDGTRPHA